jgi:hypothetical protein
MKLVLWFSIILISSCASTTRKVNAHLYSHLLIDSCETELLRIMIDSVQASSYDSLKFQTFNWVDLIANKNCQYDSINVFQARSDSLLIMTFKKNREYPSVTSFRTHQLKIYPDTGILAGESITYTQFNNHKDFKKQKFVKSSIEFLKKDSSDVLMVIKK